MYALQLGELSGAEVTRTTPVREPPSRLLLPIASWELGV